jgi:hypothetical protein
VVATPAAPGCRDQVEVELFRAVPDPGIVVSIDSDSSAAGTQPRWGLSVRSEGMRFEARAYITSGLLRPEQIRLHFIQNVTQFMGSLQARAPRASPSDPIVEKALDLKPLRSDCGLPLLDMYRDEAPPPAAPKISPVKNRFTPTAAGICR